MKLSKLSSIVALLNGFLVTGCGVYVHMESRDPFAIAKRSNCPGPRVTIGEVIACHPVLVSQDLWGYADRGLLATALERSGVALISWQGNYDSQNYLDISAHSDQESYMTRVTVNIRDQNGRLRYFGDATTSEGDNRTDLSQALRRAIMNLCVVEPLPCP